MLPKGFTRISISRATEARLIHMRNQMIAEEPTKYDENISWNTVISWLVDHQRM